MRLQDLRLMTGLGKSSIYAAIQAGKFPSPVNLTHHAVAWRESEVAHWIAQRPKASALATATPTAPALATATAPKPPSPARSKKALPANSLAPSATAIPRATANKPAMRRMVKTSPKTTTATTSRKPPAKAAQSTAGARP